MDGTKQLVPVIIDVENQTDSINIVDIVLQYLDQSPEVSSMFIVTCAYWLAFNSQSGHQNRVGGADSTNRL